MAATGFKPHAAVASGRRTYGPVRTLAASALPVLSALRRGRGQWIANVIVEVIIIIIIIIIYSFI